MPSPSSGNIMEPQPGFPLAEEEFTALCQVGKGRIERIISDGQASPDGFWYDQDEDEWVMILEGEADLEWESPRQIRTLRPMDWVLIPAHQRHRVARTQPRTVWLAVWGEKSNQNLPSFSLTDDMESVIQS